MRFLSRLVVLVTLAAAIAPALAARPDPGADCRSFTTVQSADGRIWEIQGLICLMPGKPPKVEVTERREADPARTLKQRLIW